MRQLYKQGIEINSNKWDNKTQMDRVALDCFTIHHIKNTFEETGCVDKKNVNSYVKGSHLSNSRKTWNCYL